MNSGRSAASPTVVKERGRTPRRQGSRERETETAATIEDWIDRDLKGNGPMTDKITLEPAIPARVNPYGQPDGEGKFGPGNPGGPGRPKGSRNKVGNDLKVMIMNAAMRTGFIKIDENGQRIGTGLYGCEGYLMWAALYEPRTYLGLLARILPYYITSDVTDPVMSRAEIEAQFKEFGLPMASIEHLQKAPTPRLDDDENPDPYGMNTEPSQSGTENRE
jgi:hypothetical protein